MENTLKNARLTHFDPNQMANLAFDGGKDAFRVSVVDGITVSVENLNIPELKMGEQLKVQTIEVPNIIKEIEKVEVPVIIKEIERVEVPVIIKEVEVITVEKPIIIPEIKIVEVEKPIIVKEIQYLESNSKIPTLITVCMVIQALSLMGLMVSSILK